jgi:hypothetical protein
MAFSVDVVQEEAQIALTEQWVLPFIQPLLGDLKIIRDLFDNFFLKETKNTPASKSMYGVKSIQGYPTGYCLEIRDGVYEMLKNIL